jgi:peptidoglycan/LPS O-acetylase OafA/YrhL
MGVASTSVELDGPAAAGAENVVAPPPGHPRFPLFDSLRAIAVLTVLVGHTALFANAQHNKVYGKLLAHANLGVVIFFVISGFLLYRPMVASRFGGPRPPRIRDYARRRALRIVPAFWLAMTLLAIWPGLEGVFTSAWWAFYGLMQTYPIYDAPAACAGAIQYCGIPTAWSLCVEGAFYVSLPLVVLGARALTRGRAPMTGLKVELVALAVLAAASIGVQIYAVESGHGWLASTLPSTFIWFALGMSLALLSAAFHGRRLPRVVARPEYAWGLAIAIFAGLSYLVLPVYPDLGTTADQVVERVGLGVVAALLVLPAVFGDPEVGFVRRLLAHPVLSWIGLVSFGVFLWHYSIAQELATDDLVGWIPGGPFIELTVATIAISLAIAALSYYLLERPILRFK